MTKLTVTQTQADAIDRIRNVDDAINGQLFNMNESDPLMSLSAAELARALHVGYEVEREFNVGDWVITEGYLEDYDGRPLQIRKIICEDYGCFYYFNQSKKPNDNFARYNIKRCATDEEIAEEKQRRWWKKHDRKVWELREEDILYYDNEIYYVDLIIDIDRVRLQNGSQFVHTNISSIKNKYIIACFVEDRKDL